MSVRRIPQSHEWTGPYTGNYLGDLWKTYNVDLDRNEGFISLSQRMERIEDSSEFTGNGLDIYRFLRCDADCTDRYWALGQGTLFKTDSASTPRPTDDWDTETLDSAPTTLFLRDFSVHSRDSRADSGRHKLIVTLDTDISVLNDTGNNTWTGGWWTSKHSQPPLDSSVGYHPIEYFPFRKISIIGDGNKIHTISRPSDTQNDTVTNSRLILPPQYTATKIFTTTSRAWICCLNKEQNGQGVVVEWDGFSQTYNGIHNIYAQSALSGVNHNETPIIVNSNGSILEFNGSGFQKMIRNGMVVEFPVVKEPGSILRDASDTNEPYSIVPHGMVVGEDGFIYMNVARASNANASKNVSVRQVSGIWSLNPNTGRLYSKYTLGLYANSSSSDYGSQDINATGALFWVSSDILARNLLASSQYNTGSVTYDLCGIYLNEVIRNTAPQRGYFITQYLHANNVSEFWDSIWIRCSKFFSSGDKIIIKARGTRSLTESDGEPLQPVITWTSTTTFTLTLSSLDDALVVGDEVEVIGGINSGYLAHITTISGSHGALQTITIDETTAVSSGTANARFERWKKLGEITSLDKDYKKINIGIDSSFIQFKIELRGVPHEVEIKDLVITSKPSTNLEN